MKKLVDVLVVVLLIIGGLNWGLWGLREFDAVAWLFGATSMISRIIYYLVGLAAIYALSFLPKMIKR